MNENSNRGISLAALAALWGCSRSLISKYVKNGMPMGSREEADAWRAAHATRGIGFRSKGVPQSGRPAIIDSERQKNSSPGLGTEGGGEAETGTPREKWFAKRAARTPTRQLKTLAASLLASIQVESEALRLVQEAQASLGGEDTNIPLRIAAYNKAKEGRMQSEKLVRAFDLETKTILTWEDAVEMAGRFMIPLITRLRSIPKRAGAVANPADDVYAESVISKEIEAALAEAQDLYVKATTPGA